MVTFPEIVLQCSKTETFGSEEDIVFMLIQTQIYSE